MTLDVILAFIEIPLFLDDQGVLFLFPGWDTHRIQNKEAIGDVFVPMRGKPVIREDRVGQVRCLLLVCDHLDIMFEDFVAEPVELLFRLL